MDDESEILLQTVTPKYATLLYEVRKVLDITWIEYVYLDMVYHLSHDGWCFKSLDNVGLDLGIDRSNVWRMQNRLVAQGLLLKNKDGHTKTSVTYAKRIQTVDNSYAKRNTTYAKRNSAVVKTHTKNNNRITLDIKQPKKIVDKYGNETLESAQARLSVRA